MSVRQALRSRALRASTIVTTFVTAAAVAVALGQPAAVASPPEPPSAAEAAELLNGLTVAAEGSNDGYDRDKFPHWITQEGTCNTREVVLKRDGTDVQTDDECRSVSGTWYSVYDDTTVSSADDIQIDHIVALSEAWHSGASEWTLDQREAFANDLEHSQLIAVSGSSNQSKSDNDPAEWKPANQEVWCVYGREWIWVKSVYGLTVDEAEKAALEELLGTC
jgi:hypothetical protein